MKSFRTAYVIEVVELLRETQGTNAKVEILKQALSETKHFRTFVKAVYDPLLNLYIKELPEYDKSPRPGNMSLGAFVDEIVDQLGKRKVTGSQAKKVLANKLSRLDLEDQRAAELLFARDMKCGVSAGSLNKAEPGLIYEYPCMLCGKMSDKVEKEFKFPAIIQTKFDGMRCNIILENGVVTAFSRNASPITISKQLEEFMLKNFPNANAAFDGELICVNDNKVLPRKTSNGICTKAIRGTISDAELDTLRYIMWDVIPLDKFKEGKCDLPYTTRMSAIQNVLSGTTFNSYASIAESKTVDSWYEVNQCYQAARNAGEEGVILKDPNGIWENKRVNYQIKIKAELDADLVVVDIVEGQGKYQGKLGAFICATSDGLLNVSVGSGFSDEQRDIYFNKKMIGKIIQVKYNEVIGSKHDPDKKSLFLPIFVTERLDKSIANSLLELK